MWESGRPWKLEAPARIVFLCGCGNRGAISSLPASLGRRSGRETGTLEQHLRSGHQLRSYLLAGAVLPLRWLVAGTPNLPLHIWRASLRHCRRATMRSDRRIGCRIHIKSMNRPFAYGLLRVVFAKVVGKLHPEPRKLETCIKPTNHWPRVYSNMRVRYSSNRLSFHTC